VSAPSQAQQIRDLQEQVRRIRTRLPPVPDALTVADLIWQDDFTADHLGDPTLYIDVGPTSGFSSSFFVASNKLQWNPAIGNGGWLHKPIFAYNTMQAIHIASDAGNTGDATLDLLFRTAGYQTNTGMSVRLENTAGGGLGLIDMETDASFATSTPGVGLVAPGSTAWLVGAAQGDRLYGALLSVDPSALTSASQVLTSVSGEIPVDSPGLWMPDRRVGFNVFSFEPWTFDDYKVWKF
jgi:hypothetical protein